MKKIISLVLVLALGLASVSLAAGDTWTSKADMPTARLGLSTSVVDGKIYAIGGGYSIEGPHSRTVEEYDPVTDTWTTKADMPTGRLGHSASVINGKIYVIGGDLRREASGATVEEYDPITDTWTTKADMPTKRTFLCTCAVDGRIYAIGGITAPAMHTLSTVEEYDPATDTWTKKADMPTPRWTAAVSAVDGKIYAVGGLHNNVLRTVEEYDPTTDTWTRKADMQRARSSLCTSVVNGKVYAIGGASGGTGPVVKTVEEYDPITDTWTTKAEMPTARWFFSTSALNGKIYAIGGSVRYPPHDSISTVEEYDTGLSSTSPDFNGDGTVDIEDLIMLIEHWGQDEPSVDIAPPPFGDGIVDVQDLEVLMSYWQQEVLPVELVAYWKLDETEGEIAYDSVGENDAYLIGDPIWQPAGGIVYGALQFDGIDDYVSTEFVLNPADGEFSVFAWIKDGAPGQAVLSQIGGVKWLCADILEGNLMTELKATGRGAALLSQTVITDGNWHRIGLVWDGSHRTLYVDDVAVAEDAQTNLEGSDNGLYIGTGNAMEPGSFFSGLIDDVRIYGRAISP